MPITFESIKDPYGIQQASGVLGQALMQKGMQQQKETSQISAEKRAQETKLADEQRTLEQQKLGSQTLGKTLNEMQPKEGEKWDQNRAIQFMSKALSEGVPISDILTSMKAMGVNQPKAGATANTPFAKKMATANVDFLTHATESGRKAKEMLGSWDDLDAAINDPERSTNLLARGLKMTPLAPGFYSPADQAIATASKEVITNLTNMKGLRLTDAKLKWLEGIAPAPWKTIEANKEASQYFKRILKLQDAYGDIASDMANSYTQAGLDLPNNFEKLVDKAVEPIRQEIDTLYKNRDKGSSGTGKSLEVGATFNKMPSAKGHEGDEITDDKGNKFVSDGSRWKKVK